MITPETKKEHSSKSRTKSPYFMQPAKDGAVAVYRRPSGNRATPKLCGTMPNAAMAKALVAQLQRAESAVDDLFLEATDDGIEALEAILEACRQSVLNRGAEGAGRRRRGRRKRGDAA